MNPVIYYRVNRPAKVVDCLPVLDLDIYYDKFCYPREAVYGDDKVAFVIKKKEISAEEIENIEISDPIMSSMLQQFSNFTPDQDRQVLELIDN